jgi:predicted DsbA family dithiol-disulfide isomerase
MKVELFLADCKLCERMLNIMEEFFSDLDIEIHRASECKDGSCCIRAAEVGVKAVPSLVVDGRVIQIGVPTEEELVHLRKFLKKKS